MAWIDWEKVGAGVEKAGAGWSASIRRELELGRAEERQKRMFFFRLGEETKARKELMEYGNEVAMDLEKSKATLNSELLASLGSPQLQTFMTEASKPGRPEFQMQAMATRDLIGRIQRFERVTPEDAKLLQTLPPEVQSPIAMGMGAVNKYYQKEDRETERFEKWGAYMDAQTEQIRTVADALKMKASGFIPPEQAQKTLDGATKALATLTKDEYYRTLSMTVANKGVEGLRKEQQTHWNDYMKRYAYLQATIAAMSRILYGEPTKIEPTPPIEEIVGEDFLTMLEQSKVAGTIRTGLGEAGKFMYEMLIKGWSSIEGPEIIKGFKETFIDQFK